jgi:hypothetical protein
MRSPRVANGNCGGTRDNPIALNRHTPSFVPSAVANGVVYVGAASPTGGSI